MRKRLSRLLVVAAMSSVIVVAPMATQADAGVRDVVDRAVIWLAGVCGGLCS